MKSEWWSDDNKIWNTWECDIRRASCIISTVEKWGNLIGWYRRVHLCSTNTEVKGINIRRHNTLESVKIRLRTILNEHWTVIHTTLSEKPPELATNSLGVMLILSNCVSSEDLSLLSRIVIYDKIIPHQTQEYVRNSMMVPGTSNHWYPKNMQLIRQVTWTV